MVSRQSAKRRPNVGLLLTQRRRRWANSKPALCECTVIRDVALDDVIHRDLMCHISQQEIPQNPFVQGSASAARRGPLI